MIVTSQLITDVTHFLQARDTPTKMCVPPHKMSFISLLDIDAFVTECVI